MSKVVFVQITTSSTESSTDSKGVYVCKVDLASHQLESYTSHPSKFPEGYEIKYLIFRSYTNEAWDKELAKLQKLTIPVSSLTTPVSALRPFLQEACLLILRERPPPPEAVIISQQTNDNNNNAPKIAKRVVPIQLNQAEAEQRRINAMLPSLSEQIPRTNLMLAYINACARKAPNVSPAEFKAIIAKRIVEAGMDYNVGLQRLNEHINNESNPNRRIAMLVDLMEKHSLEKPSRATGRVRKRTEEEEEEEEDEDDKPADSICEDIERFLADVFTGISPRVKKDTLKVVTGDGVKATTNIQENVFLGLLPVFACSEEAFTSFYIYNPAHVFAIRVEGTAFVNPDVPASLFSFMAEGKTSPLLKLRVSNNPAEVNVQAVVTTQLGVAVITTRAIQKDEALVVANSRDGGTSFFDRINGKLMHRPQQSTQWATTTVSSWVSGIPSFINNLSNMRELIIPEVTALVIDADIMKMEKNKEGKIHIETMLKSLHGGTRWQAFKRMYRPETPAMELTRTLNETYALEEMRKVFTSVSEYPSLAQTRLQLKRIIDNERTRLRLPGEFPFFHNEADYNRMTGLRERCIQQQYYQEMIAQFTSSTDVIGNMFAEYRGNLTTLATANLRVGPGDQAYDAIMRRAQELAVDQVEARVKMLIADVDFTRKLAKTFEVSEEEAGFSNAAYRNREDDSPVDIEDPKITLAQLKESNKDSTRNAVVAKLKLLTPTLGAHEQLLKYTFYREFIEMLEDLSSGELAEYHKTRSFSREYRTFYASELLAAAGLGRWTDDDLFFTEEEDIISYITTIMSVNMGTWVGDKIEEDTPFLYPSVYQHLRNLVTYRKECIDWFNLATSNVDNLMAAAGPLNTLLNEKKLQVLGLTPPVDIEKELALLTEPQLAAVSNAAHTASRRHASTKTQPNAFEPRPDDSPAVASVKAVLRFMLEEKEREGGTEGAKAKKQAQALAAFVKLEEDDKYVRIREARREGELTHEMILAVLSHERQQDFDSYVELWELYHEKEAWPENHNREEIPAAQKERIDNAMKSLAEDGLYLEDIDYKDPVSFPKASAASVAAVEASKLLDIALHYYRFVVRKSVREANVEDLMTEEQMWELLALPSKSEKEVEEQLPNYPSAALYAAEHDDDFMLQVFCQRIINVDKNDNKRILYTYDTHIHADKLGLVLRDVPGMQPPAKGLFATKRLPFALCLGVYGGEVITNDEYLRRYPVGSSERARNGLYLFRLHNSRNYVQADWLIDGRPSSGTFDNPKANIMSFINDYHGLAPAPNVEFVELFDVPVIKVITIKDINPGEQLLADYGSEYFKPDEEPSPDTGFNNNNNNNNNNNTPYPPARDPRSAQNPKTTKRSDSRGETTSIKKKKEKERVYIHLDQ